MAEIPLIFPAYGGDAVRRYAVSDTDSRIYEVSRSKAAATATTMDHNNQMEVQDDDAMLWMIPPDGWAGSASISSLRIGQEDVIITTSLLSSGCLSVVRTGPWSSLSSPSSSDAMETTASSTSPTVMIELDLHTAVKMLERPAKIQCLTSSEEDYEDVDEWIIHMIVIDVKGNCMKIDLDATTLQPRETIHLCLVPQIFVSRLGLEDSGVEVHSSRIAVLSNNVVVMSLSPFVVAVHITKQDVLLWSESRCLQQMSRRKSSSFVQVLSKAGDILMGKSEDEQYDLAATLTTTGGVRGGRRTTTHMAGMDLPHTSALCVTTSDDPDESSVMYVFTLHDDATMRRWRINPYAALAPLEVVKLASHKIIPPPTQWVDGHNSVALCARLYGSIYTVAVHVQTELVDDGLEGDGTPTRLWVLHGPLELTNHEPIITSDLALTAPRNVTTLVGFDFNAAQERCSLSVMFQTTSTHDASITGTVWLTYLPAVMTIVTKEPVVLSRHTLDDVAQTELARIEALSLSTCIDDDGESSNLEDDIHQLDALYLKELFRPAHPRGAGMVLPPPTFCIQSAISKLVYGRGGPRDTSESVSIELETLQAMHAWRTKENRGHLVRNHRPSSIMDPTKTIYERYIAAAEENDRAMMAMMTEEDEELLDLERIAQVEAHEKRWRGFLLQVWEEEQSLRMPLAFQVLSQIAPNSGLSSMVVRAGVTSYLPILSEEGSQQGTSDSFSVVDQMAGELLQRIHCDPLYARTLDMVEQRAWNIAAKGLLASDSSPHKALSKVTVDLAFLGDWARRESDGERPLLSDTELESILCDGSNGDLFTWLQKPPLENNSLHGLQVLKQLSNFHCVDRDSSTVTTQTNQTADLPTRQAASTLTVLCMESVRKIHLCRCLLFFGMGERYARAKKIVFRAFLQATTVMWAAAQQVPVPTPLSPRHSAWARHLGSSSPSKKPSIIGGSEITPLLPNKPLTTALDALMIHLSQTATTLTTRCGLPVQPVVRLAHAALTVTFQIPDGQKQDDPWEIGYKPPLPELGVLPPPSNEHAISDFPRLALRLLAPFVAIEVPTETPDALLVRREALAECLLIAAQGSFKADEFQDRASSLLLPSTFELASAEGQDQLGLAIEAISVFKTELAASADCTEALARKLHGLVFPKSSVAFAAVVRMCRRTSAFTLLSGLLNLSQDVDGSVLPMLKLVARSFMHLSNLIHRLDILDRHLGSSGRLGAERDHSKITTLITFIEKAIKEVETIFPLPVLQTMPEYSNLWMFLYRQAVWSGEWQVAFSACISDPALNHRIGNFKGLVRAMVEEGSLQDLLDKRSVVSKSILKGPDTAVSNVDFFAESVDFYEVAAETLATASVGPPIMTIPTSLGILPPDYHAALYALHVSQDQWRRASQSMDMRFIFATQSLADCTSAPSADLGATALMEGRIVEDLVLASTAASNALYLVGDDAHRFLVSGEVGPFPFLPTENTDLVAVSKRTRESDEKFSFGYRSQSPNPREDRLSRFMMPWDLVGRAVRTVALRTLCFDGSSKPSFVRSAFLRESTSAETDQEIIAQLAELGYFDHCLLLAKASCATSQEVNSRASENELFREALSFVLRGYLIPLAVYAPPPVDPMDDEGNSRPALLQLHRCVDSISAKASSMVLTCTRKRSELLRTARCIAAMELVRNITTSHTTAEFPLATRVADVLLESDQSCSQLPSWLERLLKGEDSFDVVAADGLFARRAIRGNCKYLGDPSALLNVYMKWGMYVAACNVVTSVLSGKSAEEVGFASRQSKAPSRLPEKGDLDFLPYRMFDILWEMIDIVVKNKRAGPDEICELRVARKKMEESLEMHFELMKISEMGANSARALSRVV